jgi:hypothetical protein
MSSYLVQLLPDSEGKTEVTNSGNGTDILLEDIGEKVLLFELLD